MTRLSVEHHRTALGIGEDRRRLSWQVSSDGRNWVQTAYQTRLRPPGGDWSTAPRADTPEQILVPWPFSALRSREQCDVSVRVWGSAPEPSAWSAPVRIETGLLSRDDWTPSLIRPRGGVADDSCRYVRSEFEARAVPRAAAVRHRPGRVPCDPQRTCGHRRPA